MKESRRLLMQLVIDVAWALRVLDSIITQKLQIKNPELVNSADIHRAFGVLCQKEETGDEEAEVQVIVLALSNALSPFLASRSRSFRSLTKVGPKHKLAIERLCLVLDELPGLDQPIHVGALDSDQVAVGPQGQQPRRDCAGGD